MQGSQPHCHGDRGGRSAYGTGPAWTWPSCGAPRRQPAPHDREEFSTLCSRKLFVIMFGDPGNVVAEPGQQGFELSDLALREAGTQPFVEGHGRIPQAEEERVAFGGHLD